MRTFLRRLEILNFLRSKNLSVGTEEVVQHLVDASYLDDLEIKTKSQFRLIQRDLRFLLGKEDEEGEFDNDFGLSTESGLGKSRHWRLDPYQQLSYDFEKMPAYMALALSVSQKHLKQVLPSTTRDELQRIFSSAEEKLQKGEHKLSPVHYKRLSQSVEFFQRGQQLKTANFDVRILDSIYQAILRGKRISFNYQSKGSIKEYDIHPFGVAIMLPKLYLIGKKETERTLDNDSFRSFLVHKIKDIEVSQFSNRVPEDFKLKDYLETGEMDVLIDYTDAGIYQLEVEISVSQHSNLISDLRESPISYDQQLVRVSDQLWRLRSTVKRTIQLRNWIISLGKSAKIIAPSEIRKDVIHELDSIRMNYEN